MRSDGGDGHPHRDPVPESAASSATRSSTSRTATEPRWSAPDSSRERSSRWDTSRWSRSTWASVDAKTRVGRRRRRRRGSRGWPGAPRWVCAARAPRWRRGRGAAVELGQLGGHVVEGGGEPARPRRPSSSSPGGRLAGGHRRRRLLHLAERTGHAPGEHLHHHEREQRGPTERNSGLSRGEPDRGDDARRHDRGDDDALSLSLIDRSRFERRGHQASTSSPGRSRRRGGCGSRSSPSLRRSAGRGSRRCGADPSRYPTRRRAAAAGAGPSRDRRARDEEVELGRGEVDHSPSRVPPAGWPRSTPMSPTRSGCASRRGPGRRGAGSRVMRRLELAWAERLGE